jgi:ribonuclease E
LQLSTNEDIQRPRRNRRRRRPSQSRWSDRDAAARPYDDELMEEVALESAPEDEGEPEPDHEDDQEHDGPPPTKVMIINATEEEESRVAVLDQGRLEEFYIQRASLGSLLGNIYKGRVVNVEPSIQAAFVDIGGPRHAFLSVPDVQGAAIELEDEPHPDEAADDEPNDGDQQGDHRGERRFRRRTLRKISDVLKKGQEVLVQVVKDGIGNKGPTLTTYLSLPGRYLVLMPNVRKRGVSRKIDDAEERERLKALLNELDIPEDLGVIVRTVGSRVSKRELMRDYRYLSKLWALIQKRSRIQPAPSTLYQESDLVIRVLRDLYSPSTIGEIVTDSETVLKKAQDFLQVILPRSQNVVRLADGPEPLFHRYGVEEELERLNDHRIELKSGGSIIIEQTEAIVAIDVNSGRFREEGDLEETAYKINLEAAQEITRQLRLRDLGGVIINDFIDMRDDGHRRQVERAFREALKSDRARIKVARMSQFGIIEMTRQRVRPSLKRSTFERCATCDGSGYVATPETVGLAVLRSIRLKLTRRGNIVDVAVSPRIAEYLANRQRRVLLELEDQTHKQIVVYADGRLRPDEFHVETRDIHNGH